MSRIWYHKEKKMSCSDESKSFINRTDLSARKTGQIFFEIVVAYLELSCYNCCDHFTGSEIMNLKEG